MRPPTDGEIKAGRDFLRRQQAGWAARLGAPAVGNTFKTAMERASRRESSAPRDGPYVRQGNFKYPLQQERQRWRRTRQIIERVQPGPFEDPVYFENLARHAAAIELVLHPPNGRSQIPGGALMRVIIGTTGEPRSEAYSASVAGTVVVAMSGGMMDFLYQSSKAVALAWKPKEAPSGRTVSFSGRPEDTREQLNADPYPIQLFRDTVLRWLHEGLPRAEHSSLPAFERQLPLELLITGAERFILAHEYAHALKDHLKVFPLDQRQPKLSEEWQVELSADAIAMMIVGESCRTFDLLPPNMALQGAVLAMKAHEIFDEVLASDALRQRSSADVSPTHPPFHERINLLQQMYLHLAGDSGTDVAEEDLKGMLVAGQTLDEIWLRARPDVEASLRQNDSLHRVWTTGRG